MSDLWVGSSIYLASQLRRFALPLLKHRPCGLRAEAGCLPESLTVWGLSECRVAQDDGTAVAKRGRDHLTRALFGAGMAHGTACDTHTQSR